MRTPEDKQAGVGCVILALGLALGADFAILGVAVDLDAGLRALGGVILADYALERVLVAWRTIAR